MTIARLLSTRAFLVGWHHQSLLGCRSRRCHGINYAQNPTLRLKACNGLVSTVSFTTQSAQSIHSKAFTSFRELHPVICRSSRGAPPFSDLQTRNAAALFTASHCHQY